MNAYELQESPKKSGCFRTFVIHKGYTTKKFCMGKKKVTRKMLLDGLLDILFTFSFVDLIFFQLYTKHYQ